MHKLNYYFIIMENYNWEESNICKFDMCTYYDYNNDKCSLNMCKKLDKKKYEKN